MRGRLIEAAISISAIITSCDNEVFYARLQGGPTARSVRCKSEFKCGGAGVLGCQNHTRLHSEKTASRLRASIDHGEADVLLPFVTDIRPERQIDKLIHRHALGILPCLKDLVGGLHLQDRCLIHRQDVQYKLSLGCWHCVAHLHLIHHAPIPVLR